MTVNLKLMFDEPVIETICILVGKVMLIVVSGVMTHHVGFSFSLSKGPTQRVFLHRNTSEPLWFEPQENDKFLIKFQFLFRRCVGELEFLAHKCVEVFMHISADSNEGKSECMDIALDEIRNLTRISSETRSLFSALIMEVKDHGQRANSIEPIPEEENSAVVIDESCCWLDIEVCVVIGTVAGMGRGEAEDGVSSMVWEYNEISAEEEALYHEIASFRERLSIASLHSGDQDIEQLRRRYLELQALLARRELGEAIHEQLIRTQPFLPFQWRLCSKGTGQQAGIRVSSSSIRCLLRILGHTGTHAHSAANSLLGFPSEDGGWAEWAKGTLLKNRAHLHMEDVIGRTGKCFKVYQM
ncbi:hypothetical protein GUITHDRAFT_147368 [Guillardia theta CCMP2712]|uniref:Uncharacterized protein n=1 Tax=Guillardia theta (strain CCMP2712) TaxID=905079 RepID=L1ID64_GUITC|nr:hypothetical protein GUITHDRAFT_147368 [Guillardia theta CCMP2712]EKX34183.1 hypothetical protein GUITHDRAFT_147368 [Guillardia theta CCMP2712]|eukprot:XP_005821163.1 hypothetical protein GUITHDRAFT_147368 [Guillardia theta CCMP2712]